jgi:transposase InsO family protein
LLLQQAKRLVKGWRAEYNQDRPHSSLGGKTLNEVAREKHQKEKLTETSS